MITIQTVMLVALGFLGAALLGLLLASAFWSRAVRLTTARIKHSMPVSETEIKADRDRLRAEYAIKVHKLETQLDHVKLERARQLIEINRRDASISALESDMSQYRVDLEENQNARRVLEQTVSERLPKVEARLAEAKRLLFNRDREIAELMQGAKKHKLALEEASSLNAQQNAQIERLSTALTTRSSRGRAVAGEGRGEVGETALRSELDALRSKTREQAILIDRLQLRLGHGYLVPGSTVPPAKPDAAASVAGIEGDMDRLRKDLAGAETGQGASRGEAGDSRDEVRATLERDIRSLKARSEDQSGEIARLRAALSAFEQYDGKAIGSLRDSKIALKARLGSAQAQADQQMATITRLRAELAAAHERLARQAAHFMDEMRRIGAGTVPTSGQVRRPQRPGDRRLAERVARITGKSEPTTGPAPAAVAAIEAPKPAEAPANGHAGNGSGNGTPVAAPTNPPEKSGSSKPAAEMPKAAKISGERRRPRLLDRITSLAKD